MHKLLRTPTLVKIGAEARIELVDWNGKKAIRKQRVPKEYRDPKLDEILRARRTKQEAELIHAAKGLDVESPYIYFVSPVTSEIIMEYVEGTLLKDADNSDNELYRRLGEYCASLHSGNIIHGDLTTKNVISSGSRLVLIDFGLAFYSDRLEDKAEDIHLLKQALKSSCDTKSATRYYDSFIEGYFANQSKEYMKKMFEQITEIEARGRYARVD